MKINFFTILFLGIFLVFTAAGVQAKSFSYACKDCHEKPVLPEKHVKKMEFKDCFSCHKSRGKADKLGSFIHAKHLDESADADSCYECHKTDSEGQITVSNYPVVKVVKEDVQYFANKLKTWVKSEKLVYSHRLNELSCSSCHTTFDYEETDNISKKCIDCHGGYETVKELTTDTKKYERNPHESHYPNLKCEKCHKVHEDFKDYCDKCHHTGFKWSLNPKESN